ncbi:hypothetical protein [Escherichia coli]
MKDNSYENALQTKKQINTNKKQKTPTQLKMEK